MEKKMSARRNLVGFVIAIAAAFCMAGGLALTAFADPQPAPSGKDPAAANAGLTAQSEGDVSYIQRSWDGNVVTEETKTIGSSSFNELPTSGTMWFGINDDNWYVVSENVTISDRIVVNGTVNLILCDGATLTMSKGITVENASILNIYPGSTGSTVAGTGKLYAGCQFDGDTLNVTCESSAAGIGGTSGCNGGTVAIHGGTVTATGKAAGIGGGGSGSSGFGGNGGAVTVYGGTVTATGKNAGIGGGFQGSGGAVTVYGGTVTATGGTSAAGIGGGKWGNGGTVSVYGGDVTATGDDGAAGIGGGDVRDSPDTSIGAGGNVSIYGGALTAFGGAGAVGIGCGAGSTGSSGDITLGDRVTLTTSSDGETWSEPTTETSNRTQFMRVVYAPPVSYQAWNESSQRVEDVAGGCAESTEVTSATEAFEDGTWYVVSGADVQVSNRIVVNGAAHLILRDGASLNANKGIAVADGSSLNIYAQSVGANKGRLIAGASSNGCDEGCAGIGGGNGGTGGAVTIHGGAVTAIGGAGAAGIGGGNGGAGGTVTLYGDTVNTAGGEGAKGIGAGSGGSSDGVFNPVGASVFTSSDNAEWAAYDSTTGSKRYMKTLDIYVITLSGGANATPSGSLEQSVTEFQEMSSVTFTVVHDGYCFPATDDAYGVHDGVEVAVSDDKKTITVSGTPTANADIKIPDAVPVPVTYQAWDEDAKVMESVDLGSNDYYVVGADTKNFASDKPYVVSGNVTISDRITVSGEAHLILRDGATLTANKGITVAEGNTLNIYAQSEGEDKGRLIAGSTDGENVIAAENAGIGGESGDTANCGTVNIHGGAVTATGGSGSPGGGAGIGSGYQGYGGTVTVYGGEVNANGGNKAAGIGSGNTNDGWVYTVGTVTVYGGAVTATGGADAAGIGGGMNGKGDNVTIHGGTVNANGGAYGAGIGSGGWLQANEGNVGGTVTINGGTVTAVGGKQAAGIGGGNNGNAREVTIGGGTVIATGGEKAAGIGGGAYGNGSTVTVNGGTVKATGSVGASGDIAGIGGGDYGAGGEGVEPTESGTLSLGLAMALYGGDTSEAKALLAADQGSYEGTRYKYMEIAAATGVQPVPYQAWDEESGTVKAVEGGRASYTVVDAGTTAFGDGKWYVVSSSVTVPERITVTGTVHLILCDGATLTASKGITVANGNALNTLNVYAQSAGENKGQLIAGDLNSGCEYWDAAIGGLNNQDGGAINIHGGVVTATGGDQAAGIGGGNGRDGGAVAIYGGDVTAIGKGYAAGIGGGSQGSGGAVVIDGGIVTATSGDANAMGIGAGREGPSGVSNGTLTLGASAVPLVVSSDNTHWSVYSSTNDNRAQYMKSAGDAVTVTLAGGNHATHTGGALTQNVVEGTSITEVTFTADAGYAFDFTDFENNGITVAKTDDKTVKVSGSPTTNTEIEVPDAVPAPVTYQAWDATSGKMTSVDLESNTSYVMDANTKKLASDKPYIVSSDVTISGRIELEGESATLIICDGATLTASQGIYVASSDTLNIYPGSTGESVEGTGTLIATGAANMAGIGSNGDGGSGGTVVIHGGTVEATGGENAAGIGSGSGASEGTVANRGCDVTVYGGTVKATGGTNSVGIGAGDNGAQHGTLTLNGMALYGGASAAAKALIAGSLNGGYGGNHYTYMEIGAAVSVDPILYKAWDEENGVVLNVDEKCTSYIAMDASTTTLGDGNWYVVSGDVAVPGRITVDGTAHLIICDGAALTASKGVNITGATLNIYPGSAQGRVEGTGKLIAGSSAGGCDDHVAAIGSDSVDNGGTLKIHGGDVTAVGGKEAAGIGGGYHCDGGTINVYSGIVTATGGEKAAGIGGGNQGSGGIISIYGGDVTAAGGANAAGIGGGDGGAGGTVIIRNCDVTAVGGQGGAGIGGGATGSGGPVTIYNSIVDATGGQGAAGIGGGSQGDGGTVAIDGGTVTTAAGLGAEGIGSGDGLGAHGSLTLGASLALYGGDNSNLTALAKKDVIESVTHYERSRYMMAINAVEGVKIVVDKLPAFDEATAADKEAIASARAAYDDLTDDQKSKVATELLEKLEAAEDKIAILQTMSEISVKTGGAAIYTGSPIQLIDAPTSAFPAGYTMKYAVTAENKAPTTGWSTSVPTATDAGTYYVWYKVEGDANHNDSAPASVEASIARASIDGAKVELAQTSFTYDGKAKEPAVKSVTLGGKTLTADADYTVGYKNNVGAGTATATVTGEGNYEGTATATFKIEKKEPAPAARTSITGARVELAQASFTYDGRAKEPAVRSVTLGGRALAAGDDYEVTYSGNVNAGTATATVTGKGAYEGSASAAFSIAKAANAVKVKAGKAKVKAAKVSKKARKLSPIKKPKVKFAAKVTYKKVKAGKAKRMSGYKALFVNKKTGKVTVRRGTAPGTYKIKVKVRAAKTANTKAASKTITVKVKVTGKVAKGTKSAKLLKAQSAEPGRAGTLSAARIG